MAHRLNRLIAQAAEEDSFLVIMGTSHMGYGLGVPAAIFERHPQLRPLSYSIFSRPADATLVAAGGASAEAPDASSAEGERSTMSSGVREASVDLPSVRDELTAAFGIGTNPADLAFLYTAPPPVAASSDD